MNYNDQNRYRVQPGGHSKEDYIKDVTFELGLKGDRLRTEIVIKHSGKQASIKKVWELVGSEKFI